MPYGSGMFSAVELEGAASFLVKGILREDCSIRNCYTECIKNEQNLLLSDLSCLNLVHKPTDTE